MAAEDLECKQDGKAERPKNKGGRPANTSGDDFIVEEEGGERHSDLAEAQKDALPWLASSLASTVQALLLSGALMILEGKIIVNPGFFK